MKRRKICNIVLICVLALLVSGCSKGKTMLTNDADINQSSFLLGVATGAHSQLEAEERFPDANIQYYSEVADGCAAVKAGKLDGFMFDKIVLDEICQQDSELTTIDETYVGSEVAYGISKEKPELVKQVNAAIQSFQEDGTLADLRRRWIDGEDRTMPEIEKPEQLSGTLRILTTGLSVPFSYIADNGACIGMDVELGIRVAYALGMDYQLEVMNFDAILPTLISSKDDIIVPGLSMTEERKKVLQYSDPYFTSESTVLVRKDRYQSSQISFDLTDEQLQERLVDSKLGALSGSTTERDLRTEYPNAEVQDFPSVPDALAALISGRIDYAVVQKEQALSYINSQGGCRYCTNPVYSNEASFVVSKGNEELCDQISAVVQELRADATLDRLYEKWCSGDYSTEDIPVCADGPVLKVAVSSTAEPMRFVYNNQIVGYDCEVIQRVAYELGMQVEFQDMTFASTIPAVVSEKADVAVALTYTEERAKEVLFTEPYNTTDIVLLERTGETASESWIETLRSSFIGTFLTENRWKLFVQGIEITVLISVCAYLLGTLLGLLLCKMQSSKLAIFRGFAKAYGKIVTGIPVLVWLMILYYMVFKGIDIPGVMVAIIGFALVTGASLSGVFRTGLDSVDKGQIEAAAAMGFLPYQIFWRIVFPQAAERVFELYKGQFVALVKSTSIVGYIAIMDLTKVSDIVRSRTYQAFFPLITTALIYFGITCIFLALLRLLQHRLNPRLRKNVLKGIQLRKQGQA